MPKISIILPTYNGSRWLTEAILSIINQQETNWELIVVDDCSTDNTWSIAKSFAEKDSRIKVLRNSLNKRLPESLNIGFSHARGEYFTWTSDDNLYKENALKLMSKFLDDHQEIDMVSMNEEIIDKDGNIIDIFTNQYKYKRTSASLMEGCNVGAAFLYRRRIAEKVGQYDARLFCVEDYDYWCRIAIFGTIAYTSDIVYQYRLHSESLSMTRKKEVKAKTQLVKRKYANDFFLKFKFTYFDCVKFWSRFPVRNIPIKYIVFSCIFKIIKVMQNFVVSLFYRQRETRKVMRRKFSIDNKYSFSKEK